MLHKPMQAFHRTKQKTWLAIKYLYIRLMHEGYTYRAASLAYTTLLATVPMLIIIFRILSYFPQFQGITNQAEQVLLRNFIPQSANVIAQHLADFAHNVQHLTNYNIAFLVILDVLMIYNINQAFNDVWRTKIHWRLLSLSFLVYFVVLMLAPIVLGGVLVLGSFIYKMPYVINISSHLPFKASFYTFIPYLISFVIFTVFNWLLPARHIRFVHGILGGLLTTIIFELAKYGFAFYLRNVQTYQLLYGALSALPLFLVWLYFSWLIILFGALVTNLVADGIPEPWKERLTTKP